MVLGDVTNHPAQGAAAAGHAGSCIVADHAKLASLWAQSPLTMGPGPREDRKLTNTGTKPSLLDILKAADMDGMTGASAPVASSHANAVQPIAFEDSSRSVAAAAVCETDNDTPADESMQEQMLMPSQRRRRSARRPASQARMHEVLQALGINEDHGVQGGLAGAWPDAKRSRVGAAGMSGVHSAPGTHSCSMPPPAWVQSHGHAPLQRPYNGVQSLDTYVMGPTGLVPSYTAVLSYPSNAAQYTVMGGPGRPAPSSRAQAACDSAGAGAVQAAHESARNLSSRWQQAAANAGPSKELWLAAGSASAPASTNPKASLSVAIPTGLQTENTSTPAGMFLDALPHDMVTPVPLGATGPLASLVNMLQMAAAQGVHSPADMDAAARQSGVVAGMSPLTPITGFSKELLDDWLAGRKRMSAGDLSSMQHATANLHAEVARLEAANQAKLARLQEHAAATGRHIQLPPALTDLAAHHASMQTPAASVASVIGAHAEGRPALTATTPAHSTPVTGAAAPVAVAGVVGTADVALPHTATPAMLPASAIDCDAALHALAQLSPAVAQLTALLQQVQNRGDGALLGCGPCTLDAAVGSMLGGGADASVAATDERSASSALPDLAVLLNGQQPGADAQAAGAAPGTAFNPFFDVLASIRLGAARGDAAKLGVAHSSVVMPPAQPI